ncbi:MAG: Coenzyme F420 hydrogenase/dehydrogenase, beta subunit C-terminal domain [Candidatus Hadarchaeia archaeon]
MSDAKKVKKVFGHLTSEVHVDLCSNCGACIASCPMDSLKLQGGRPSLSGRCTACGLCYAQCPQVVNDDELRSEFFDEESESNIGVYKDALIARFSDYGESSQDGGFVTGLLTSLLEKNYIDGAVLMDRGSDWRPEPKVVTTSSEIEECAGSKYTPGPLLISTREAVERYDLRDMAVVGLPCQVKALRGMSIGDFSVRKITDNVKLMIGLFCKYSFGYDDLKDKILGDRLEMDLADVSKFDMNEEEFIIHTKDGEIHRFDLDSLDQYAFTPCTLCGDYSAEFSDISVGRSRSTRGWSSVILRTSRGEEAFNLIKDGSLEFEKMDRDELEEIAAVSGRKMKSAEESINIYADEGKPLPPRIKDNG